jgi:3-phenylpropionate/trans-cinnamate dioxygenase ferredoxin subunit
MAEYETVARLEEVRPGALHEVEAAGRSLLLANVQGEVYAIAALCTHLEGPLSQGTLEGSVLTCPWHGSRFDVRTGGVLNRPATEALATYPVRVEDGDVKVALE